MCLQFLCHHCFVYRTKVDTCHIIHYGFYIGAKEYACQYTNVIHIELEQIFAAILYQRERRLADSLNL